MSHCNKCGKPYVKNPVITNHVILCRECRIKELEAQVERAEVQLADYRQYVNIGHFKDLEAKAGDAEVLRTQLMETADQRDDLEKRLSQAQTEIVSLQCELAAKEKK